MKMASLILGIIGGIAVIFSTPYFSQAIDRIESVRESAEVKDRVVNISINIDKLKQSAENIAKELEKLEKEHKDIDGVTDLKKEIDKVVTAIQGAARELSNITEAVEVREE